MTDKNNTVGKYALFGEKVVSVYRVRGKTAIINTIAPDRSIAFRTVSLKGLRPLPPPAPSPRYYPRRTCMPSRSEVRELPLIEVEGQMYHFVRWDSPTVAFVVDAVYLRERDALLFRRVEVDSPQLRMGLR